MTIPTSSKYKTPVFKKDQPDDNYKFRPLPKPSGRAPYRLTLPDETGTPSDKKLVFHIAGDTGSVRDPDSQQIVAEAMAAQYRDVPAEDQPKFLYHLGDIVYHFGEAEQYDVQFFRPYRNYPGPIFAIPGNHDSDVNLANPVPYQSLDAFKTVFCDTEPRPISFNTYSNRESQVQPNVYWTMQHPLATIIGLASNVPKYGVITGEQRAWFREELTTANQHRAGRALIICLHHSPYSADINHGSSRVMIEFLESIFRETGIRPDAVFSGHVHNYQRFHKQYADGVTVPFIVSGAGGFDELHAVATTDDDRFNNDDPLFNDVQLQHYCDDKHGFLRISIKKTSKGVTLTGEYFSIPVYAQHATDTSVTLADSFTLLIG